MRAAAAIALTRATVTSGGLVVMTCFPASAAAMAKSPWVPLGVKTPTTSTSSRAISSAGEVVQAQPHSSPLCLRRLRSQIADRPQGRAFRFQGHPGAIAADPQTDNPEAYRRPPPC